MSAFLEKKRVLVLGAGQIASGYDSPGDSHVLTHLHALTLKKEFFEVYVHDLDAEKTKEACRKWGVSPLIDLASIKPGFFNLVVVATPDSHHSQALDLALNWQPNLVLCEKPLTLSVVDAERTIRAYEQAKIPLLVNFQRRYDARAKALRKDIQSGSFGAFLWGSCRYSKGILHNGVHAVDFLHWIFGHPLSFVRLDHRMDYLSQDPSVNAYVEFERAKILFQAGDEREFSIFEIELAFARGRFVFENSGRLLRFFEVKEDPDFPGYRELYSTSSEETELATAMSALYDEVLRTLDSPDIELTSPASDSLPTLKLIQALIHATPVAGSQI